MVTALLAYTSMVAAPTVQVAVKTKLSSSYQNDMIIVFFFTANKKYRHY